MIQCINHRIVDDETSVAEGSPLSAVVSSKSFVKIDNRNSIDPDCEYIAQKELGYLT